MPNRWAFLDMNSFFTSVEQQERPELRGIPTIVAPMLAETTCALAASYEAKAYGIKTGTLVKDARKLCPQVQVVESKPRLYREYHERIVEILHDHFVTIKPLSIDEMACRVSPYFDTQEKELKVARKLKDDLIARLGPCMTASVGVAPNIFLGKVVAEMQKPDGLTILNEANNPQLLFKRTLSDLPGIGRRMLVRLQKHNIHTVEDLWNSSRADLHRAWGGIVGERWWHMLRGSQEADYGMMDDELHKSVGHSHVLPPNMRTPAGAKNIVMRLCSKALKRLRTYNQAAGSMYVYIGFRRPYHGDSNFWEARSRHRAHANDDITWMKVLREHLDAMPPPKPGCEPMQVSITFTDLILCTDANLTLFGDNLARTRLCKTVDALNDRFGYTVDLASVYWLKDKAPYRIPFGKTLLDSKVVDSEPREEFHNLYRFNPRLHGKRQIPA